MSRASTVFTTHTPVPAGIDRFSRELIEQYFGSTGPLAGVPIERILALGAEDYDGGDPTVFNMAVMGFRLGQRANGVSQLHGHVSREMFHGLWPAFDEAEVPITSITNGVHAPTWVGREVFELATRHGAAGEADDTDSYWSAVDQASSADIWAVKRLLRERLVHDARRRLLKSCTTRGFPAAECKWVDEALDPDRLLIGFARRGRAVQARRPDPRRRGAARAMLLARIGLQLVYAGKAHPRDGGGKALVSELVGPASRRWPGKVVFLENYDMTLGAAARPAAATSGSTTRAGRSRRPAPRA